MLTKRSFSLLRVCVVAGVLAVFGEAAFAQFAVRPGPYRTARYRATASIRPTPHAWTPIGMRGVWQSPARLPLAPVTVPQPPQSTGATQGEAVINNTNVVIVQPPNYPYYGGPTYYGPWYPRPITYHYFDRGLFNGMMGPFGLSSTQPLKVTTIP